MERRKISPEDSEKKRVGPEDGARFKRRWRILAMEAGMAAVREKDIETLNRENAKVKSLFDENQSDSII